MRNHYPKECMHASIKQFRHRLKKIKESRENMQGRLVLYISCLENYLIFQSDNKQRKQVD